MRVLVTGGSGFIGRHVVSRLRSQGDDVRVVDLVPASDPEVDGVVGDVRDPEVVRREVAGQDAIVHLAAMTSVLKSANDPHGVYESNVMATQYLLEAARDQGVGRFVFASTNAVVGNVGHAVIDEQATLRPLTPYGATKAAAEMLLAAYGASYGITTVSLRLTNVYGAGMQVKDSVVARLMRAALDGGGIQIYGDGEQVRDYLYVTDAAAAFALGLRLDQPDVLTIGGGGSFSTNQLVRMTSKATGVEIGTTHIAPRPGEMPAVIVDTAHAQERGFRREFDLEAGLKVTWADFTSTH